MALTGGIFTSANQFLDDKRQEGLHQQQLDLQGRAMDDRAAALQQRQARQLFQDNQSVVGGLIEASLQSNKSPQEIEQLIMPVMESARKVLDPNSMLQLENFAGAKIQAQAQALQQQAQQQQTQAQAPKSTQPKPTVRTKEKLTGIAGKISGIRRLMADGTLTEEQGTKAVQDLLDNLGGKSAKKEDAKASKQLAKRQATLRSAITKSKFFDTVAEDAIQLSKQGEKEVVGAQGLVGMITQFFPGTDARKLGNTLDTLRANIGFDKLQEMRANSPTGGALGQVSNLENLLLQATSGRIDQFETPQQLQEQLIRIRHLHKSYLLGTLLEHHIANSFDEDQKALAMQALDALSAGEEAVGVANKFKEMTGFDPFSGV